MAHYTFKYTRGPERTRVFKCAMSDYDRLNALLTARGWVRVFDPPLSVTVYGSYQDYVAESTAMADQMDQDGSWTGITD